MKLQRGRASAPPDAEKPNPAVIDLIDREAVVEDISIQRFIPRLEAVLAGGVCRAVPRDQPAGE